MTHSNSQTPKRFAILGGGISGLAAAVKLLELANTSAENRVFPNGIEITLYEASGRTGGAIKTERVDDFIVEHGPDMFTRKEPEAFQLCQRLGMGDELITTSSKNRRALIGFNNRLFPVPEGFSLMVPQKAMPIFKSGLLSVSGKVRLMSERFVKAKSDGQDESLESFAVRRFGKQAFERLIQPLVAGIYTADPKKLSMQSTMQRFVEMESQYGSVIRGALKTSKANAESEKSTGARYGLFMAPKNGMETLAEKLLTEIPSGSIRLNRVVDKVSKVPNGWQVFSGDQNETYDGLICALPAHAASKIFMYGFAKLSGLLGKISYAGSAVVLHAFSREQVSHPLDAFGMVMPAVEDSHLIACSFASQKFEGRAPAEKLLLRSFVGGALNPGILENDEDKIESMVFEELKSRIGVTGKPIFSRVARWPAAMPQYHLGHQKLVGHIETEIERQTCLELAGNAFDGVGIPACIRSGEKAAERLVNSVSQNLNFG